jgi:hypothetical protein
MRSSVFPVAAAAWLALTPFSLAGCAYTPGSTMFPTEVDASQLIVGQAFPALTLPTLDGTARTIADFRGQKIVLHVFASW